MSQLVNQFFPSTSLTVPNQPFAPSIRVPKNSVHVRIWNDIWCQRWQRVMTTRGELKLGYNFLLIQCLSIQRYEEWLITPGDASPSLSASRSHLIRILFKYRPLWELLKYNRAQPTVYPIIDCVISLLISWGLRYWIDWLPLCL